MLENKSRGICVWRRSKTSSGVGRDMCIWRSLGLWQRLDLLQFGTTQWVCPICILRNTMSSVRIEFWCRPSRTFSMSVEQLPASFLLSKLPAKQKFLYPFNNICIELISCSTGVSSTREHSTTIWVTICCSVTKLYVWLRNLRKLRIPPLPYSPCLPIASRSHLDANIWGIQLRHVQNAWWIIYSYQVIHGVPSGGYPQISSTEACLKAPDNIGDVCWTSRAVTLKYNHILSLSCNLVFLETLLLFLLCSLLRRVLTAAWYSYQ